MKTNTKIVGCREAISKLFLIFYLLKCSIKITSHYCSKNNIVEQLSTGLQKLKMFYSNLFLFLTRREVIFEQFRKYRVRKKKQILNSKTK